MPDALKTDATLVRGCSAAVWLYPVPQEDGRLHFLADSNAAITKGIVALILLAVQDRSPSEILALDIEGELARFDLRNQLSSNRTQGIPNMIALVRETAGAAGRDERTRAARKPRFDPERFMAYVRQVGHGGAIGIAYHAHGEDWAELCFPMTRN